MLVGLVVCRSAEADVDKIQQNKKDMQKMALVFFTIGVGWLMLILITFGKVGIWADWTLVIFKFLQPFSLLSVSTNVHRWTARIIRTLRKQGSFTPS